MMDSCFFHTVGAGQATGNNEQGNSGNGGICGHIWLCPRGGAGEGVGRPRGRDGPAGGWHSLRKIPPGKVSDPGFAPRQGDRSQNGEPIASPAWPRALGADAGDLAGPCSPGVLPPGRVTTPGPGPGRAAQTSIRGKTIRPGLPGARPEATPLLWPGDQRFTGRSFSGSGLLSDRVIKVLMAVYGAAPLRPLLPE